MESSFSFADNTVGFFFDGVVDEATIKNLQATMKEKFEKYDVVNLYFEDNGIKKFTLPAIIDEIFFKFKHANKLNKVALVTIIKWIHVCASLENIVLSTNIKSFSTQDRLNAMSWISS